MLGRLSSLLSMFFSPWGLLVLSFIDSSVFFFTPLANDLVVIVLSARQPEQAWLYPSLATIGSVGGIAMTYALGRKLGEAGLTRLISTRTLESAKRSVKEKGAFTMGALALVPPPFPLTPLVLVAGALEVSLGRFLAMAGVMRAVRFGIEAALARTHGERISRWLESPVFEWAIGAFIVVAVAGTALGLFEALRHRKRDRA